MAKKKNATRFPQGVFSLEQIEEQYAGQWVLVEETLWNKSGHPLAGRVLAHSQEKATVVETGVQYVDILSALKDGDSGEAGPPV